MIDMEAKVQVAILDEQKESTTLSNYIEELIKNKFKQLFPLLYSSGTDFLKDFYKDDHALNLTKILFIDLDTITDGPQIALQAVLANPELQIIFISSDPTDIEEIFIVKPCDFIVKPMLKDKVTSAIHKAIHNLNTKERFFSFIANGHVRIISSSKISYIESERRLLHIKGHGLNESVYMKMDQFESYSPSNFLRIHQSYLINLHHIESLSGNLVTLSNGVSLPISKTRYQGAAAMIQLFLENKLLIQ
jgi:DNA-binding LytR/AlgR family response regulator